VEQQGDEHQDWALGHEGAMRRLGQGTLELTVGDDVTARPVEDQKGNADRDRTLTDGRAGGVPVPPPLRRRGRLRAG
jgi:hypothetical protein